MEEEAIVVDCPHCQDSLTILDVQYGVEFACPKCGVSFLISKPEEGHVYPFDPLADDEVEALRRRDANVFDHLNEWMVRENWRYALIAAVMDNRLETLRTSVYQENREQGKAGGLFGKKSRFRAFANEACNTFYDIIQDIYGALLQDLKAALETMHALDILRFADKFEVEIQRLTEFHESICERPMHDSGIYFEVHTLMKRWAPYTWQGLNTLVKMFESKSFEEYNSDGKEYQLQVILMPPNIHQFYILKRKLN